jgi:peptidoglycan/LPS O-acetylase OafA/YrhL
MNATDFLWRSEWVVLAVSNLIVLGITIDSYRRRPRRSVLLIAVGAAVGFAYVAMSWMAETTSPFFWGLMSLVNISAGVLWIAGVYLLLAEISRVEGAGAEPGAPPNGGPAVPVDNSNAPGGPPSVS